MLARRSLTPVRKVAVRGEGPAIRRSDLPPLSAAGLPPSAAVAVGGESFAEAKRRSVEEFERGYIQAALRHQTERASSKQAVPA